MVSMAFYDGHKVKRKKGNTAKILVKIKIP